MSELYQYSIASQTGNGVVNSKMLLAQIAAAGITSASFEHVDTVGDALDIFYDGPLSGPDRATLDAVVAAHHGVATDGHAQTIEREPLSETDASDWLDKLSMQAPPLRSVEATAFWYAELKLVDGTIGDRCRCRVLIDGQEVARSSASSNDWQAFSGADIVQVQEGAEPVVTIQWCRGGDAGDVACIRRARVLFLPVNGH